MGLLSSIIIAQLVAIADSRAGNTILRRRDTRAFAEIFTLLRDFPERAKELRKPDKEFNMWMAVVELIELVDMYKSSVKSGLYTVGKIS